MDNYFENTDWKTQRLGRFTASEIYHLFVSGKGKKTFGVGAETYIRKKVAEEITQEVKEDNNFKQAEWGYGYEHEAYLHFEKETGFKGVYYGAGNPKFFEYGEHAGCSPDWEEEKVRGADFKCPYNSDVHLENLFLRDQADFKEKRWEYYCQAQMGMVVRGWNEFYFVSYDPRMPSALKMAILKILPDPEWRAEFSDRLPKAIERKSELMDLLISRPVVRLYSKIPEGLMVEPG